MATVPWDGVETLANHSIPPSKSLSFAKTSIVTGVFFAVVAVSLFTIMLSLDSAATGTCGRDKVFDSLRTYLLASRTLLEGEESIRS